MGQVHARAERARAPHAARRSAARARPPGPAGSGTTLDHPRRRPDPRQAAGRARRRLHAAAAAARRRLDLPAGARAGEPMSPDEYCRQKAAASGSSFYYSFLFLPPERRRAIIALYAFCREVDDVVDEVSDPGVARSKLAWWRQEVASIYDSTPQHPVAQALVPVVRTYALPQAHL